MLDRRTIYLILALGPLAPQVGSAQGDTTRRVPVASRVLHGLVMARGTPVVGANVFDLETLEGAVTAADGRFIIMIADTARPSAHLTVRRIGFRPADTTLALGHGDTLTLTLTPFTALAVVTVQAGQYTSSAERTATLTPLEVATTPGTNADVNSAIKTLPGVQAVDEGSGLFVRGGDFTETKTTVDGAPLFSAYQFDAPTGSVAGTINPFLLDKITFSSGGFGAQNGNALSAIVDLRTLGRPARSFVNGNVSVLNGAVGGGLALSHGFGVSATAGMSNLEWLLDFNGNPRRLAPAPHGNVESALAVWEYRPTGILKVFALRQESGLGVPVDDPAFSGTYLSARTNDVVVASWQDVVGRWRGTASASSSGLNRHETYGAYDQWNTLRLAQVRGDVSFEASERLRVDAGAELDQLHATFGGTLPTQYYDRSPGAPTTPSQLDRSGAREAAYLSLSTRPTTTVQLITGVRADRSEFTTGHTLDPRVSLGWVPQTGVTVTAAWGIYHQVADPAFLDRAGGTTRLAPLEAEQAMAGVQLGDGPRSARVELWSKRYQNLVGLTRQYATVTGLAGSARGADVFARVTGLYAITWRLTYSAAESRRTDPNTLTEAPAAYDVTHSVTAVAERGWAGGWRAGIAWRYATGHPFTDITSASYDAPSARWVPAYGAPSGERLPDFRRLDISVSRARPLSAATFWVWYISVNNLLNDVNTFTYTWSRDYSRRIPVRSFQNRTIFVGMNLSYAG